VDPESPVAGGRFETFDANARFVVIRDDDGYAVWRLEDLGEGEPIQRFADDDSGYELAADMWAALMREERRRRSPWLSALKWIVIVSAIVWIVTSAIAQSMFYVSTFDRFRGGFSELSRFYEVMQVISSIGYSFTLGATAIYLVLWLEARRER